MPVAIVTVPTFFMKSLAKCEIGYSFIPDKLIVDIFSHQDQIMDRLLVIISGCPIAYNYGFA